MMQRVQREIPQGFLLVTKRTSNIPEIKFLVRLMRGMVPSQLALAPLSPLLAFTFHSIWAGNACPYIPVRLLMHSFEL